MVRAVWILKNVEIHWTIFFSVLFFLIGIFCTSNVLTHLLSKSNLSSNPQFKAQTISNILLHGSLVYFSLPKHYKTNKVGHILKNLIYIFIVLPLCIYSLSKRESTRVRIHYVPKNQLFIWNPENCIEIYVCIYVYICIICILYLWMCVIKLSPR